MGTTITFADSSFLAVSRLEHALVSSPQKIPTTEADPSLRSGFKDGINSWRIRVVSFWFVVSVSVEAASEAASWHNNFSVSIAIWVNISFCEDSNPVMPPVTKRKDEDDFWELPPTALINTSFTISMRSNLSHNNTSKAIYFSSANTRVVMYPSFMTKKNILSSLPLDTEISVRPTSLTAALIMALTSVIGPRGRLIFSASKITKIPLCSLDLEDASSFVSSFLHVSRTVWR